MYIVSYIQYGRLVSTAPCTFECPNTSAGISFTLFVLQYIADCMCCSSLIVHVYLKVVESYNKYSRIAWTALCTFECRCISIRNIIYFRSAPTYCRLYVLRFAVGTYIYEGSGVVYCIQSGCFDCILYLGMSMYIHSEFRLLSAWSNTFQVVLVAVQVKHM